MSLSAQQQAQLERPAVRTVYFLELQFKGATVYINSSNITFTWGGFDWIGLGAAGGISDIDEVGGVVSKPITFELNITDQSFLQLAIGPTDEYSGRPALMYYCPLDENFVLEGTPLKCWNGIMDLITLSVEEKGKVSLKCETSAHGLKRQAILRLNANQHKLDNPTDTGLDHLTGLIAKPQVWLSNKAQRHISNIENGLA